MTPSLYAVSDELAADLRRWRGRALVAGGAGILLLLIGLLVSREQFFRSYLWAYLFVVGLTIGSMGWTMLHHLTGGAWGVVVRRLCEAAARTVPLIALLFVPVALGIPTLYEWSHADVVAHDEILRHKSAYLNVRFFLLRAAVYFAGWFLLARLLDKWSAREDETAAPETSRRLQSISAPGVLFLGLSVTFMAIDWVMSITPHWFSTMFGLLFIAGQALSAMAFLIVMLVALSGRRPLADIITYRHLHDLGKLLLALVMVWAYFSFSQFLIVWSGNLPEEIPWYLKRLSGGWLYLAGLLVLLHFALPFSLLLSRDIKRNFRLLTAIALAILAMRLIDLYWIVVPDLHHDGHFSLSWLDLAAPLGLIGVWLAFFFLQLPRRPLLPVGDPHLEEALAHGRH